MQGLIIICANAILWVIFLLIIENIISKYFCKKMNDNMYFIILFLVNICPLIILIICQSIVVYNSSKNNYHCSNKVNTPTTIFFALDIVETSIILSIILIIATVIYYATKVA